MNLKQLEYFKVLAETEHMTQSAEKLNMTQPNLSHAIKDLEEELKVKLFQKSGRNIKLTKYGKQFYQTTCNVLFDLNKGIEELQNLIHPATGKIDFGFTYTMALGPAPQVISDFKSIEGNALIEFNLIHNNSTQLIQSLLNEEIDIALCSKIEDNPNIDFFKYIEEEIVLIVPKDHELAQLNIIDLKDTKNYPFISFNDSSGLKPTIDTMFSEAGFMPKVLFSLEEDNAMASFVSQGFGIALVPNIPTLKSFDVAALKIKEPQLKRYLYIATLKRGFLSTPVQNFLNFLRSQSKV